MRSKSKPVESGMNSAEMRNMMMILRLKYDIPTMDDLWDILPRDHALHAQLPGYKLHTLKKTTQRSSQNFVDLTEEVAVFHGGSVTSITLWGRMQTTTPRTIYAMDFGSSLDEGWRRLEGAGASAVTLLGSGNEMRNTQGTVNCKMARFVRMSMEADNSQRAGEVVCFVELGITTLKEKRLLLLVDVFPVAMDIRGLYERFNVDGPRNLSLIGVEHLRQLVSIIPNTMRSPPTICTASCSDLKCKLCLASKATHKPFPNSESRAGKPLDLVHIDLLSFDGELSLANHRYALVVVDDCTRYMWVLTMPQKSDSFERFKTWKLRVELSSGHTLKVVRSDRGGEFLTTEFKRWLDDTGLSRQLTIPSTPEQNGVAERANRSISEAAQTMLYESGLPTVFWAEAVAKYVYVKNRSPHSALGGKVPFREWTGKPAHVHHLRVFGCRAWHTANTEQRKKLQPRGLPMIFLGYDLESKAYRLWDPVRARLTLSRSVTFFEDKFPAPDRRGPEVEVHAREENPVDNVDPAEQRGPVVEDVPKELRFEAPGPAWAAPVGKRDRRAPGRFEPEAFAAPIPTRRTAAMAHHKSHEWAQGAIDEFESLRDDYSVFTIMKRDELPAGAKVLGSKFVYRTKRNKDGRPTSYKAQLVARGFTQRPGIDFKKTFAPTAKFVSIRTLIALAVARGYHIIQADIDKAYLHGELEEELYMRVPEGIRLPDNVCLKLHRSIYGLKQAGRVWNETIHKTLVNLGYNRLRSEECVYRRTLGKDNYYIAVYVDDLLFIGPDLSEIDRVLNELDRLYGVKRLGNAEYILGVQLIRQADRIALSQRQYLLDVLARFGMADANKSTQYRSSIGLLMYAVVATWPDLAYPVSYLARFTNKAGSDHWAAVLKILRYIKGTLELGIVYKAKRDLLVGYVGYSDSDWGSCINTSRSTMGHVFKLADGPISWSSRIQSRVATSSTEAQYIGLTHAS
ncbi:BQ5605_C011g06463 [Microbotryum silenes-dioicae]|uniref:BQ5605_C011g06463 protein n=1 Tax=Microbotryum silenes-dioicae TaxID=796604 RepID=A0A2X0LP52_9BASI|nr:BQ5605_C011g06463 [Microbotryum silenes-dioicae]